MRRVNICEAAGLSLHSLTADEMTDMAHGALPKLFAYLPKRVRQGAVGSKPKDLKSKKSVARESLRAARRRISWLPVFTGKARCRLCNEQTKAS
jgi:hypothetical protein